MIAPLKKAMILAAGFGTRLKPHTDSIPKALVPYKGKPMIQHVIEKLKSAGIEDIVVNTHYLYKQVEEFFANNDFGVKITLSHEQEILETGGGIKNARKLLEESDNFLVYNTDVDCGIDINLLYEFHIRTNPIASLAVNERKTSRPLLFDTGGNLCGRIIEGKKYIYNDGNGELSEKAFCGIHIISGKIFGLFPAESKFDIISFYMNLVKDGGKISGYDIGDCLWKDLGKPENLT